MQNQEYVLAALDMDGTLLNSRHEISDYTRRALSRAGVSRAQIFHFEGTDIFHF